MSFPNEETPQDEIPEDDYFYDENLEQFTESIDTTSAFNIINNTEIPIYDFLSPDLYNINMGNFFNILYNFNPYLMEDINNYIDEDLEQALSTSFSDSNNFERCEMIPIEFSTILYNSVDNKYVDKECSICLMEFDSENKLSVTKCSHVFHNDCIKEWSKYKIECPICRSDMI